VIDQVCREQCLGGLERVFYRQQISIAKNDLPSG
jgi:hypothetical protein